MNTKEIRKAILEVGYTKPGGIFYIVDVLRVFYEETLSEKDLGEDVLRAHLDYLIMKGYVSHVSPRGYIVTELGASHYENLCKTYLEKLHEQIVSPKRMADLFHVLLGAIIGGVAGAAVAYLLLP